MRSINWDNLLARVGEMRNAYVFVGRHEGKHGFRRHWRGWECATECTLMTSVSCICYCETHLIGRTPETLQMKQLTKFLNRDVYLRECLGWYFAWLLWNENGVD
jgi:hypothetical protein